jgi:hypothetical protein
MKSQTSKERREASDQAKAVRQAMRRQTRKSRKAIKIELKSYLS